jgi:hypothetical protein
VETVLQPPSFGKNLEIANSERQEMGRKLATPITFATPNQFPSKKQR